MPSMSPETRDMITHISKQTLEMVAQAIEQGIELTPDVVRFADVSVIRENGKDVLAIVFPTEDEDAWLDSGPEDL